ncbi:hypothetical protein ACHAXS_010420 [Conticribra weissflogii]
MKNSSPIFSLNKFLLVQGLLPTSALSADEIRMGTTILATRYKGGVVVGADTRTSVSGYVSNRYAAKLTFVLDREVDEFVIPSFLTHEEGVNENETEGVTPESLKSTLVNLPFSEASTCVICRSGSAADTQHLSSVVRIELVSRQLLYRMHNTVTNVAALLRNLLANEPELSASLICAGYDHELKRGVIYSIAPGGAVFEEKTWAAGGSGSSYILGHLDSKFRTDDNGNNLLEQELDSEEDAIDFIWKAISLAMDRDGSSGGFIRMYVIDKHGRRFISRLPTSSGIESSASQKTISPVKLKNFAPPAKPDALFIDNSLA